MKHKDIEEMILLIMYDISIENGMDFDKYDEKCEHESVRINNKKGCTCSKCEKCTAIGVCEYCLVNECKKVKRNNDIIDK